ncbi:MAG TPA: DUF2249 domain-containing protein [Candidatus Nanopelagicaceae bacterium]
MKSISITEKTVKNPDHACNCGTDQMGFPELDATLIPSTIRHAAIFGALDSLAVGSGMILLAPHKPLPLLAQIEQQSPGKFSVTYLNEGPEKWHVQFLREN